MFQYKYIGEEPRDFPTLGVRANKGDVITSETPLASVYLEEIQPQKVKTSSAKNNEQGSGE